MLWQHWLFHGSTCLLLLPQIFMQQFRAQNVFMIQPENCFKAFPGEANPFSVSCRRSVVCAANFRINRFMFQSNDLNGCPSFEKGCEQEMKGKSVSNSFSEMERYLFIIILRNCSFYLYLFKNSNLFIYSFYENNSRMFCFSSGIIKKNILNINILFVIFLHTNILDIVLLNIT